MILCRGRITEGEEVDMILPVRLHQTQTRPTLVVGAVVAVEVEVDVVADVAVDKVVMGVKVAAVATYQGINQTEGNQAEEESTEMLLHTLQNIHVLLQRRIMVRDLHIFLVPSQVVHHRGYHHKAPRVARPLRPLHPDRHRGRPATHPRQVSPVTLRRRNPTHEIGIGRAEAPEGTSRGAPDEQPRGETAAGKLTHQVEYPNGDNTKTIIYVRA